MSFIRGTATRTATRTYVPGAILTRSTPLYLTTENDNEDIWFEPHQTFTVIDCRPHERDNLAWWVTAGISGLGIRTYLVYTGDFYPA